MSQQIPALNVVNTNGSLKFDGDGVYKCDSTLYKINTRGFYRMEADDYILIKNTSGNVDVVCDAGILSLICKTPSSNAIILNASNTSGGIQNFTGTGGFNVNTINGDIDLVSHGSNINIGVSPVGTPANQQTQFLNLESFNTMTMNSGDIYMVSSDVLSFVSNTGDIQFGTSSGGVPVLKFQNGNVLINQSSSFLDRQLDIAITHESAADAGYNGIVVNSFLSNVASDLTLQTSNTVAESQCILSMGAFPANDIQAKYRTYLGFQSGNVVVRLDGPAYSPNRINSGFGYDFTYADIGKQLYWTVSKRLATIQSLGTTIIGNSDTSNITVSGTYSGANSRVYLIQIDSTNPLNLSQANTFMWSNNGGVSFQQTFIPIPTTLFYLDSGLSIQFASQTGYTLYQQFIFQTKITAIVDTTEPIVSPTVIPIGETFYSLQEYYAYFGTTTPSDIVMKTNNHEKLRITSDGSISIQQKNPSSCLELDSNYGKIVLVNKILTGYQINPTIAQINYGGYVIVWNSQNMVYTPPDYVFDVYGQYYLTDGTRYGDSFKVNNTTTDYQSFPNVAGQRIKGSPYYIVVWSNNSSPTFNLYAQLYHYNIPQYNFDILVATGGYSAALNNQLYPKAAGLYNGNYIIVWASADLITNIITIQGRIMNSTGGFQTSQFQISSIGALTSRNYPYVAGLPSDDPYVPNGFVVGYMVKLDTNADSRYTISIRIFNSDGTPYSSEIPITSVGSLNYSSITDGLLSVAEINLTMMNSINYPQSGFVMSFYRNYQADTTLYNISNGVQGLTSGATASIAVLDPVNRIITLQNVSNRFLIGEEISIASTVPNIYNVVEKIDAINFISQSTANVTLNTGYKNVVAYRFNSNVAVETDSLWNIQVNTSELFQDLDLINIPSNSTVFQYKRPLAAITVDSTGTAIVSWSNGSIPSVYYQLLNVADGSFIGTEQRLTSQYDGLKQRDQVVAHLQNVENNDFGFVISWDNQNLDLSSAGVYQQLIGSNHSIISFEDGNNNIFYNHTGQLGIGTYSPTSTLHIKTPTPTQFNDPANPVSINLQNTATHIITNTTQQSINLINGNSTVLGAISVSNSLRYSDLYPQPTNLIGFYKFDQTTGTQVPDSSSASSNADLTIQTYVNTNGVLVNFDVENCWQSGLINNCLAFNGVDNYVFIESTATNGLNTVLETGNKQLTLSVWVNVASNVVIGSTMDIVSNGGDLSLAGTYLLTLSDIANNGQMVPVATVVFDGITVVTLNGVNSINDGNWHLINLIVTTDIIILFIDGTLNASTTFANTFTYVLHSGIDTTFGIRNTSATGTFFCGYMDELRFYNCSLFADKIRQIYYYGSNVRGSMVLSANDDFKVNTSVVLDDTGKFNNLNCKPLPYTILSGVIIAYSTSSLITGQNTHFTTELIAGDIITLGQTQEFTVISVINDTTAFLNIRGYTGPETNKSFESVLRKPNVFSFFDNGDNILGHIDNYGNMMIGSSKASTMLEISGVSGNSNYVPQITLTNTTVEDTPYGRLTAINYRGYDATNYENPPVSLGQIAVSHYCSSINPVNDNQGIMQIGVNNGSGVNNIVSIVSGGNIGIGNENNPQAQIHMLQRTEKCTQFMQSGAPLANSVFDEQSFLYFGGIRSIGQTISPDINNRVLSAIGGSNDSNTLNLDGRIDFYTNNLTDNTNGIESRMTITRTGSTGIGILQPLNLLQAAPELRVGYNVNTILSVASGVIIQLSNNIFSTYLTPVNITAQLIGATVVVSSPTLVTCSILSISSPNTMIVSTDLSAYVGNNIYINLQGLNVSKTGFIGVNTTAPNTMLAVNGGVSMPILTVNTDYNLAGDQMNWTILADTTLGGITITLPSNITYNLNGRVYNIKNIGAIPVNIIVAGGDSATIDGAPNHMISTQYNTVRLQSDGSNWWII